ncbi:MAG: sulfatase-like hydrolase/transferase [Gemmatimonas sp.]|nr:sulfatase-like hydrolase/transferase [Gemmatimonas sp.]
MPSPDSNRILPLQPFTRTYRMIMRRAIRLSILLLVVCLPWIPTSVSAQDVEAPSIPATLADLQSGRVDHVVLISIDGLRPDFYLDATWPAPTLQELARQGAHAVAVRPAFPSVTFVSHTTMVTGAPPADHGIFQNRTREQPGPVARSYWHADSIRVPTLWERVREAGGTTASLWWPVTVGAEIDWNLPVPPQPDDPGATRLDMLRAAVHPADLLDELERNATGRLTPENFANGSRGKEARIGAMAAYLIETHRPTLTLVHIVTTDEYQHEHGREHPQVRRAVASADRVVGRIVEALEAAGIEDRTAIVVTGDHGFIDVERLLAPNAWLREAGLLAEKTSSDGARFLTTGGSALLYSDSSDEGIVARVEQLLASLPVGIRDAFQVVTPERLAAVGAEADVRLALSARPGYRFTEDANAEPVSEPGERSGRHGHFPFEHEIHTGFIGYGPGVPAGLRIEEGSLEDIAPFILQALGI